MNVPRWRRVLGGLVLMGLISDGQATEYYDSPRASDADKIATQMLNDASSDRFRGMNFGRPYNPFDQMIADLENKFRSWSIWWKRDSRSIRGQRRPSPSSGCGMRGWDRIWSGHGP